MYYQDETGIWIYEGEIAMLEYLLGRIQELEEIQEKFGLSNAQKKEFFDLNVQLDYEVYSFNDIEWPEDW